MPTPAKFDAVVPLPGREECLQNTMASCDSSLFNKDVSNENSDCAELPLVVVLDKEDTRAGNVKDETVSKGRLSTLIKGWSTVSSKFSRRDSCEFTTCVSPCVRKATTHLQQLKDHIANLTPIQEEWTSNLVDCHHPTEENPPNGDHCLMSCADTSAPSSIEFSSIRYSPLSEIVPYDNDQEFQSSNHSLSQDRPIETSPTLQSELTLVSADKVSSAALPAHHIGYDVVDEVMKLLKRMEDDRLSTQQMLVNERQRVSHLGTQIDEFAFKRLLELPVAVQREHESCAIDINELKWHCAYQGRLEARLRRKVDQAELHHLKIIGELESSKESCPLVREKLEIEDIAMASIQSKQDETDEELRQTLKRLEATQMKTKQAKKLAAQERILIKQDVDIYRNLLNEVSDELAQLRMNYTSNVHTISDMKNTLKENAEQCVNLEKREERVKGQEAGQHDKVGKLREKIVYQTSEHSRLTEENEQLKKDNLIMESEYQSSITKLRIEIKQYEIQVRELSRRNKGMRDDMDNTVKNTEKLKKQRTSEKKALIRGGQEAEKIKQHIEMMNEEAKKLKTLNHSLKISKARVEEDFFTEEESLKSSEQSLRNQLKEESNNRTILQARIATDTSDLLRSRLDSKKKKEKMSRQAQDADKVLIRIREQVEKLEKEHAQRKDTISQINDVLGKLNQQRVDVESKYRAKIAELRPKEEQGKQKTLELQQNMDHIQWRSDMMTKKMKDMASSTVMMRRLIHSTEAEIDELEEDSKEVKLRLEASIAVMDNLKQAIYDAEERLSCTQGKHVSHMNNRTTILEETSIALEEKLAENKDLAERYQSLCCQFLKVKELFFTNYEKIVNEETHLKDHRELHTLQGRLRTCLQHYYKLRGLNSKYQVAQFQLSSKKNNDKLFDLQQELTAVVKHINNFLESTSDGHKNTSLGESCKIRAMPMA
ncbi:coiled-coil domain-containing protein 178-like isoform X2 [Dendronephthya gigantea]|uniref:coiled-coil domain-containing protein 178-like isoform X2 n=1 Tax=Dendronephthya gigantea TaxID=151771 RepID=UPI00106D1D8A|nr:coiled-coil domain-containing protein 178-like isoform X2 [Dendronephthya gigantea]